MRSHLPREHRRACRRAVCRASAGRRASPSTPRVRSTSSKRLRARAASTGWRAAGAPPVLVASGEGLVGITFDPGGALVVASNDTVYGFVNTAAAPRDGALRLPRPMPLTRLFRRKPIAALIIDEAIAAGAAARARRRRSHHARHRRRDRRRHLRRDRHGRRGAAGAGWHGDPVWRRAGPRVLVPAARRRLRAGGALLRRAGRDDSAGGERVRLHLRHARGGRRVDHRVGPDSRVRGRQRGRRDLLGRLLHDAAARRRPEPAGVADDRVPHRTPQLQPRHPRPAAGGAARRGRARARERAGLRDRDVHHVAAAARRARELAREQHHGDRQARRARPSSSA